MVKRSNRSNIGCLWALLGVAVLGLLSACGDGQSNSVTGASSLTRDDAAALSEDLSGALAAAAPKPGNLMEITISGLGSDNPQTEAKWLDGNGLGPRNDRAVKMQAGMVPLPQFIDLAPFATSTKDSNGFRYIAATIKVRNAPQCVSPFAAGTCPGYTQARRNLTFMAVLQATTISQTAVSRFKRFDGSDANFALAPQLLPAHGLTDFIQVDPALASMQVFTENEVAVVTRDPGVTSIFPYGFVVRNINDNSRVLPGNPAPLQYDGIVTFGFRIPLQTPATEDPFKISLRFQTVDDNNRRFTQSTQEQTGFGDVSATSRTLNLTPADFSAGLSANDLVVLGGRVAQTPIGNPICQVRTAGTAAAPTAFLVNQIPSSPLVQSAPMNLSFVERGSEVSVGFCTEMSPPPAGSFVINGSQSGRRVGSGAYSGSFGGGFASLQSNQIVWNINGHRPYFPGEEVSFTATAAITSRFALPITPFVGSFRVRGTTAPSQGTFAAASNLALGTNPAGVALGDINGDGHLDIVTAGTFTNDIRVMIGNGAGVFAAPTSFAIGLQPANVTLGDVNGDGRLDVVTANFIDNSVSVLIGNGFGGFGAASSFAVGSELTSVKLGDVNGDGHIDLITENSGGFSLSVLIGNGAGGFAAAAPVSIGGFNGSVALGDVNNDGRLDIVAAVPGFSTLPSDILVLIGNGAGGFSEVSSALVGASVRSVTLGDVNGDGRLDIVTANAVDANVSVLIGNGAGLFSAATNFPVGTTPFAVTLGDVNGDGRLDIVATNAGSNNLSLLIGNGAGGFASANNFSLGTSPRALMLGDVNGDGRLDIVTANSLATFLSLLVGQ